jgi:hypothetical protein
MGVIPPKEVHFEIWIVLMKLYNRCVIFGDVNPSFSKDGERTRRNLVSMCVSSLLGFCFGPPILLGIELFGKWPKGKPLSKVLLEG